MAFSTIFIVVIIGYVFVYAGMIAYDLFIKKDPTDLLPKVEDEEVDISDEVGQFQPILIDKDAKPNDQRNTPPAAKPVKEETGKDGDGKKERKEENPPTSSPSTTAAAVSTETPDDEPTNRKSLNDTGPKEPNAEYRQHINDIVAQKRKEIEAEESEGTSSNEDNSEATVPSDDETAKQSVTETAKEAEPSKQMAEPTSNKTLKDTQKDSSKQQELSKPSMPKEEKPYKPPKPRIVKPDKPRQAPVKWQHLSVEIDSDEQPAKLCNPQTAEEASEDAKKLTLEDIKRINEQFGLHLKLIKDERLIDEEEEEIIRNPSAKPVTFSEST